jgi:hypothetical protein
VFAESDNNKRGAVSAERVDAVTGRHPVPRVPSTLTKLPFTKDNASQRWRSRAGLVVMSDNRPPTFAQVAWVRQATRAHSRDDAEGSRR